VNAPGTLHCPRCAAPAATDQEYCLECGARLGRRPARIDRVRGQGKSTNWIVPAFLGLVVAVLGAAGAIALSTSRAEPEAVSVATGGSPTVTETGPALTAPEPTGTTPASTRPVTPAPAPSSNPATVTWPRAKRGWTIVLVSLPQSGGREPAAERATSARERGLRRVGILDSSRFASLHPGYYVVFTGIFDTQVEAASALQRARAVVRGAYTREIVP
jgi:hypothetical protein